MPPRVALAALLLLRDHVRGIGPTVETHERVDALLRPLRDADGLLSEALGLDGRIAELAASFPEAMRTRAAHLTRPPSVPC